MKKIIYSITLALFFGALMFMSSCNKDDKGNYGNAPASKDQALQNKIKALIRKLPLGRVDGAGRYTIKPLKGVPVSHTTRDGGWDFSDPGTGTGFTSNGAITYSSATSTFYVAPSAFSSGGGYEGTVVAGPSSLDINYAFCFSSSTDAIGLNLFSTGNTLTGGMSGIIGISGDFENFQNATDSTSFADIFHGLAFYLVYDSPSSGSYPVIDWQNDDLSDTTTTSGVDNKCFTFVLDFQHGRLFMSKNGSLTVDAGSMSFNGEYFEISGFVNEDGEFDLDGDLTISTVPGFGTMSCN
jgi:hypothetical protein